MVYAPFLQQDDRGEGAARARVAFLDRLGKQSGELLGNAALSFPWQRSREGRAREAMLLAVSAWMEAAELCLITSQTQRGIDYLRSALRLLEELADDAPTMRLALLDAVLKTGRIEFSPQGVRLWSLGQERIISRNWDAGLVDTAAGIGCLISAALASDGRNKLLEMLLAAPFSADASPVAAQALRASPQFQVLPAYGVDNSEPQKTFLGVFLQHKRRAACAALLVLHQDFGSRLALMRSDAKRWDQLRPQAPLLDWPLLALHLGLLRLQREPEYALLMEMAQGTDAEALVWFLRTLAIEIDGHLDGSRESGSAPPRPSPSSETSVAAETVFKTSWQRKL